MEFVGFIKLEGLRKMVLLYLQKYVIKAIRKNKFLIT